MAKRISGLLALFRRQICTQSPLQKSKSWQRLKMKAEVDASTKTKSLDVKAAKNRTTWEKEIEARNVLQGRICKDDTFFMGEYEALEYELLDAINCHREHCTETAMLDAPYAVMRATFVLNMRTRKATKFVQRLGGVVVPPHELAFLPKRRVVAFCKSPEDVAMALECGASHAGDESLAAQLEQGLLHYEEFDQAVCHTDQLPLVNRLRPLLKDKLPSKQGPRVGSDMRALVTAFVRGLEFESRKAEGVPEEAVLSLPIGEACWPAAHLEQNFLTVLAAILASASNQIVAPVVLRATLACPPSDEVFLIGVAPHLERLGGTVAAAPREEVLDSDV